MLNNDEFLKKLRQDYRTKPALTQATFDGARLDAQSDMEAAELSRLRIAVAALLAEWAENDDYLSQETVMERLDAMMVGLVDADKDGELDDDELDALDLSYNLLAEYLAEKGVSNEDIDALINDADETVAENVRELLINLAPDGEDEEMEEINRFAFDSESDAATLDSSFDATYKKTVAVRNGKKTIVRKRIAGTVRLTAKQKAAIKKALRKAHSGKAMMRRLKSMRIRKRLGL